MYELSFCVTSKMFSKCVFGIMRVCPSFKGLMSRNAMTFSSSYMKLAGAFFGLFYKKYINHFSRKFTSKKY